MTQKEFKEGRHYEPRSNPNTKTITRHGAAGQKMLEGMEGGSQKGCAQPTPHRGHLTLTHTGKHVRRREVIIVIMMIAVQIISSLSFDLKEIPFGCHDLPLDFPSSCKCKWVNEWEV